MSSAAFQLFAVDEAVPKTQQLQVTVRRCRTLAVSGGVSAPLGPSRLTGVALGPLPRGWPPRQGSLGFLTGRHPASKRTSLNAQMLSKPFLFQGWPVLAEMGGLAGSLVCGQTTSSEPTEHGLQGALRLVPALARLCPPCRQCPLSSIGPVFSQAGSVRFLG